MNMKIFHASEDLIQKTAVGMYFLPMAQQNTGYGLIATSGMTLPNGVMLKFESFAYDEDEKSMDIINVAFQFVPDVSLVQSNRTGRVHLCMVDPSNKEFSIDDLDLERFTTSINNIHKDKVPDIDFTPDNYVGNNDDDIPSELDKSDEDENQNQDEPETYEVQDEVIQDEYDEEEIDASHMSKDELSSRLNEVVNNRTSGSADSNHKVYLRNNESEGGTTIGDNLPEETVSKLSTIGNDDRRSNNNNRNGSRNDRTNSRNNNQNGNRNWNNNQKPKGNGQQQNRKNDQNRRNNNQPQQRDQKSGKSAPIPLPKPPKQPNREDIYNDARMRMISKARSGK